MNPYYLDGLAARYREYANDDPDALNELSERYHQFKSTSLIDLAAVASTLAIDTLNDRTLNPLALQAIRETNPNFDPDRLFGYSDDEWTGILNSAKGKYFEHLAVEKLNQGEPVGDVALPDGFSAQMAESMTQPEWDIEILDEEGNSVNLLQLKATSSVGYIHDTLETYPDITILATSEVATQIPDNSMVLNSGISLREIEKVIDASLGDVDSGLLDHFWDSFHPLVPLLVIAGTQGYCVAVGKQDVVSAAEVAKARIARAMTSLGVGALIKTFGGGWLAIPGAVFAGWIFDRSQNIDDLIATTRKHNNVLAARRGYYAALAARGA